MPVALTLLFSSFPPLSAQSSASGRCTPTAVPVQVRGEGLTERAGDIVLQCAGFPAGTALTGNLVLYFPAGITNRVDSQNNTTTAAVSVDYGLGFVPLALSGQVTGPAITFNGVPVTVPPGGSFALRISGIRFDANQLGTGATKPVLVSLSSFLPLTQSQVTVAYSQTGFLAAAGSTTVTCTSPQIPASPAVSNLFAARVAVASTRLTEGFGSAFQARAAGEDNGTRFVITYSGFPGGTNLYLPDFVAGSSAATPTAGGDLGLTASGGQYLPASGTLLLVRVPDADSAGAGGTPLPSPTGSNPVTLDAVRPVTLTGGAGFAVYEVADANPNLLESAQVPAFVAVSSVSAPAVTQESVSPGPVSSAYAASPTAPLVRFAGVTPAPDCTLLGDCQAGYFPKLAVQSAPIQLVAAGGSQTSLPGVIEIQNQGGGTLTWTATVTYQNGSGWLSLDRTSGSDGAGVRVYSKPQTLTAGTYKASVLVDAGPLAGNATVPVTLTVESPGPDVDPGKSVVVTSVVNAATFAATPLVAGSLGTVMGANLAGKDVAVTFDGLPATLLYISARQINLQVPAGLGSKPATSLVVTVDGTASAPVVVPLAPAGPSIFAGGVLNQDNSANAAANPETAGGILQIFATGIPDGATVSAAIGSFANLAPGYAGPAPGLVGVQQVNVAVPGGLAVGSTPLMLCAHAAGADYCSPGYTLYVR